MPQETAGSYRPWLIGGLLALAGFMAVLPASLPAKAEDRSPELRLPAAPNLRASERPPYDPVTKNRIQRHESNTRALIRNLERRTPERIGRKQRQLHRAQGNLSRIQRRAQQRR